MLSEPTLLAAGISAALSHSGNWSVTRASDPRGIGPDQLAVVAVAANGLLPSLISLRGFRGLVIGLAGLEALTSLVSAVESGWVQETVNADLPFTEMIGALLARLTRSATDQADNPPREELPGALRERLAESRRFERLSPRECETLAGLVRGDSAVAIAHRHCVSLATIRSQIRAILTKLDVTSQREAVALAHRSCPHPIVRRSLTALHHF